MEALKQCTKCGEFKPATAEFFGRSKRDGLTSSCKNCERSRCRAWRAENPDKQRAYREMNKEYFNEYLRAYRAANPERRAKWSRASERNRGPRDPARHRAYRQKNKSRIENWRIKYQLTHQSAIKAKGVVSHAVKRRRLPAIATCRCATCHSSAAEYHHPSYAADDRLNVIPLCRSCHRKAHIRSDTPTWGLVVLPIGVIRIAISQI